MKKLLYSITAIAALLFTCGCVREIGPDPIKGELVETEFIVNLDNAAATKADINNDAAFINKLVIAAFKKSNGEYLAALNEANGNFTIEAVATNNLGQKQFSVKAKLVRNFAYTIGFFAMNENAPYTLGTDGAITMAAGASNDESLDAFYAVADITLDPSDATTLSKSITLTRPLAQINVLSDPADWAAAETSGITSGLKSSISIAKAPNKISLLDGSVSGNATLAFTETAIPEGVINVAAANETDKNAHYVAMAYILSSDSASPVDVTFTVPANGTDFTGFTRTVQNVPNKANYKTNLHGDLFTTQGDFTVVISKGFGGNDNQDINIPQPTITPVTNETIPGDITSANPRITVPTVTTGNNVTTNTSADPLYFGIDSNSNGDITYSSSDHSVGTIDENGVFTAVGPGTTNITVTQAAGTQTKAIGDPLAEITIVYHVTVEATRYDITFSAGDNGAFTEIKLNGDGVTPTENKISAVKNDVITFQVAPVANYEVDVVKVGDEPLTATEEVYSYTVGEAAATITATFKEMGTVATPVLSPNGGYFKSGDQVTITCETDGAAIYYTTDNEDPSSASSLYEGPINLTTECTIKAIAIKSGMINSAVTDAAHFIPKAATTIEIEASQSLTYGQTLTLTPVLKSGSTTVSEGVSFGYQVSSDIIAVTNAGVVSTTTGTGTPSVTVSATVPDAYLAPENAVVTINLAKAASTLVWNDGALEVTVGGEDLSLAGKYTTTGSPEEVSFVVDDNTVASIVDGNKVHALAAGSVAVTATLYGNNNYEAASAEKTITINPAMVTNYTITVDPDIEHGTVVSDDTKAAGETVTVFVEADPGYQLKAGSLSVTGNPVLTEVTAGEEYTFVMPANNVTITAKFDYQYVGSGTATDPYTVADVRHYIDELNGSVSESPVYVTGIVTDASTYVFSTGKTASFIIGDTVDATDTFEAYKVKYVGNTSFADGHKLIANGDNVIIVGKVTYYSVNSVYETDGNSENYIYSLNGETSLPAAPTISTPSNATEIAAADGSYLTVTLAAASGLSIYYTIDGSVPTSADTEYTAPFNVTSACTVKAIAAKKEGGNVTVTSALSSQGYTKASSVEYDWVETAITSLASDDVIVIVGIMSNISYALPNNNGTSAPGAGSDHVVTSSNNKLSATPDTDHIWTVSVSVVENERHYQFLSGNNKLYCTNTNNGVKVGTSQGDNYDFVYDSNYLKNVNTSRFIGIYNTQDWRCYTSNTGNSNIAGQTFKFYKKVEKNN